MLSLGNKLSLTTQPIYKFVNKYSIDFDGVDDRIITDGADTVAQPTTYSMWIKSSTTTENFGVFGHGANARGAFHLNSNDLYPMLYLGANYWIKWNDNSAQDDGEWHHYVVYLATNLTDSKLYIDGVLQTKNTTLSSGSLSAYTESLIIGSDRQVGGNSFEGQIDEFAVYDRELTQAEITRMYNTYYSPNRVANGNFSQIGNEEVTNGDFSQIGSEEVTNGDFASDSDWTLGGGWSISNGKLIGNNATGYALQGGVFESGVSKIYKITLTVSDYVSGYFTILTSGGTSQSQQFNANGDYTIYFNTNSPSGTTLHFTYFGSFTGSIDNVSVKEVGQDWSVSNSGSASSIITDSYAQLQTSGDLTSLEQTNVTTASKQYKLQYDVLETDGGNLGIVVEGNTVKTIPSSLGSHTEYFAAHSTTLVLKRSSGALDVKLDNISVKEVGQHWTFGSSWSTNGTEAIFTTGSGTVIESPIGLIGNRTYKVSCVITGSGLNLYMGTNTTGISVPVGTYNANIVTASNTNGTIGFLNNGGSASGTLDNIVVQELKHDATNLMLNHSEYQSANPLITSTKSMEFDGTDDYLQLSEPFSYTNHTITGWFKTDNIYLGEIFSAADSGVDCIRVFQDSSGYLKYRIGNTSWNTLSSTTLATDRWYNFACTYDGTTQTMYIDGINVASASVAISIDITTNTAIGKTSDSDSNYFNGKITEVGAFNRALTSLEVASLYNQGMPTNLLVNRNNYQSGNPTVFNTKQVDFDGADDYMIANSTLGSFTGSFSCWIFFDTTGNFGYLLDARKNSGTGYIHINDTTSPVSIVNSSGTVYVDGVASINITSGKWHHIVVTGITLDITESIFFGSRHTEANYINGDISQVGIWNSTLTANEVSSLYNHGLPIDLSTDQAAYESSSNLVGYWRMGSGTLDTYPLIADQTNATLGSEIVDFPNATINLETGWSFTNGILTQDGTGSGQGASADAVIADTAFDLNKIYKFTITVSSYTSGDLQLLLNPSSNIAVGITKTGDYTLYGGFAMEDYLHLRAGYLNFVGSISNISIKQVNGNPAIMTNQTSSDIKNGSPYANSVQNGTFDTDSDWNKQNGSTISDGVGKVVANGSISSTGGNWGLYQDVDMVLGSTYKISFSARQTGGTGNFQVAQAYVGFDQSITSSFVNYSFNITAADWGVNTTTLTMGGLTIGDTFEVDNVTVEEVNTGLQGYWKMGDGTNDAYPTIYDQTSNTNNATMTNMVEGNITNQYPLTKIRNYYRMGDGILDGYPIIQDQTSPNLAHIPTTNLFIYSEDFSQSNWYLDGVTLTSGQTSPIGDSSAFKLQFAGTNDYIQYAISGLDTTKDYTISFYAKVDSGTTTIDAGNIIAGSYEILTVTDEWQRFQVTQTPSATTRYPRPIQSNSADTIYLWGCQFEQQSQATAYLKSDGIAAVRKSSTTNEFLYSEDFTSWSGYQATSNTTTAPDGSTVKFLDFEDVRMFPTTTVTNSTLYTSSVYLKANKSAQVKIRNVAAQDTTVTLTTDWVRYEFTATSIATTTNSPLIDARFAQGVGVAGLEIAVWGVQLEQQTQAETYAKTTGLPVTIDLFTENNYGTMTNMSASDIVEDTP